MYAGDLLIGSGNLKKQEYYKLLLRDTELKLLFPENLGISPPEEIGITIYENALLKARYYYSASGLATLADDAGFEIPALDNFPGTKAHRFVGADMSDEEVISGILEHMSGLQGNDRSAKMKLVLALCLPDGSVHTAEGSIEGTVPTNPDTRRMPGFPYRSLLYLDVLKKWFYDLTLEEEEKLGYRASAVQKIKSILQTYA